jgi:hypothetical protein
MLDPEFTKLYSTIDITTSADALLNAPKNANAAVLQKRMRALVYEAISLFVRAYE